ncbi:Alpha-tocopherol transfer protein-like [Eumeta japonica]|uniref:Alpha-tocopherol transfer protein-like n=1 Tax=Eumeta variegata TaxID=151549 RepID=A0A4C1VPS1_EUMVA|nr:Alpha-tocopherol transfer protein-like [Eumeta japonica]
MVVKIRPLSSELAEKARVELNEDPQRLQDDLQHIKDWITKQPHLRARTDDQWLAAFLRGCKFSLERTKEKLDLYYSLRSTAPEITKRIPQDDPKFTDILNLGVMLVLPNTWGPTAPRVTMVRAGAYDPSKYHITDIISVGNVIESILLIDDDQLVVVGPQIILDLDQVTVGHLAQMTPSIIKKLVVTGQDALPVRMKGFHFINTPPGFETLFNFMKSLLSEKNKNRLHVHNRNYDELYKHIPKEALPTEYEGNSGTIQSIIDHWEKKVQQYSSWLEEETKYGTDESRRLGKPKTAEDMFGVDGSFRKLQFD